MIRLLLLELGGSFIVTLNFRAIADMNYYMTAMTDLVLALMTFTAIKLIIDSTTVWEKIGYVIGAVVGPLLALWTSQLWQ